MKILHGTRNTTRLARALLLVWVLALIASWANACVLQQGPSPAEAASFAHAASHDTASHGHAHAADVDHEQAVPGAAPQACKDFCDSEQTAVVKPRATGPIDPGIAPLVIQPAWAAGPVVAAAPAWRPPPAPHPSGPPIAIRFLRLTI